MNKVTKTVGFIHISSIILLIVYLVSGCCSYAEYDQKGELIYAKNVLPPFMKWYLVWINSAIYVLTLLYFIALVLIPAFKWMKNKIKEKKTVKQ